MTSGGAPTILQMDNGKEFENNPVRLLEKMWPRLRIVHGRPRHPQSQGSVERTDAEVTRLLRNWRGENGGKDASWVQGLPFVQFQINKAYNSGIKMSPCEALYGKTASVGLASTSLPPSTYEVEEDITEDIYEAMIAGTYTAPSSINYPVLQENEQDATVVPSLQEEVPRLQEEPLPSLQEEEITINIDNSDLLEQVECAVCSKPMQQLSFCNTCGKGIHLECTVDNNCMFCIVEEGRSKKRKLVNDAQDKQAAKMLKRTEANLPQLQVGDNVRVAIPKVDRGRADSPNVIGVITDVTQHGNYKVGTKHGQLKGSLARNAVEKCKQKTFLTPESVPDAELSVRQTASHVSFGQGFLHCSCKTGCVNGRCKCRKSSKLCNSRCHPNLACKNKG